MDHLTEPELAGYRARSLEPETLVRVTGHLAGCEDCRGKLRRMGSSGLALEQMRRSFEPHLTAEQVQRFVDGDLESWVRADVEQHVAMCGECASDVQALREFALRPASAVRVGRSAYPWWLVAAAAAVLIAAGAGLWIERPVVVIALQDGGSHVTLDSRGRLAGLGPVNREQSDSVRRALQGGTFRPAVNLGELQPPRGALMGAASPSAFDVSAPLGTAVLSRRPNLQWTARGSGATYIVTVKNITTGQVTSSPSLQNLEWRPAEPLQPGATYEWQVAASLNGREDIAPTPPAPSARFLVLPADVAARLENLPQSHLLRATLYAEAGLLDDAEREAEALKEENPGSNLAGGLLQRIQSLRRPAP